MHYLIILLCILTACERPSPIRTTEFTGTAMTIDYRIVIGTSLTPEQTTEIQNIIDTTFNEINTIYNKWNPASEISHLNSLPAHTSFALSSKLYDFLKFTDHVVSITEGRFDPTIEPLQELWKQSLSAGQELSPVEIEKIAPVIGWKNIHFNEGVFTKDHDNTMIDLGGIAKGFAVDLLAQNLEAAHINSFYVEWGGEIKTHGIHPHKRPWKVYISRFNNTNPNDAIAFVELQEEALATSGDYLQYWKVGNTLYFHILDPASLRPLQITSTSLGSASVAASSCALADGLATAALTFSSEAEASNWLEQIKKTHHPEIRYWLLGRNISDTH
jgi:thiamine biosynthesis lipoprotein